MLVEHKFHLSRRLNKVSFIEENLFIRVYNQSAFIVTTQLNVPLKLAYQYIKKCNNQLLISGGLPKAVLLNYFPNAIKTQWGYELTGHWNLHDYAQWQNSVVAQAATQHTAQALPALAGDASAGQILQNLSLNQQELNYLQHWHKGKYPIEMDLMFIENLKKRL